MTINLGTSSAAALVPPRAYILLKMVRSAAHADAMAVAMASSRPRNDFARATPPRASRPFTLVSSGEDDTAQHGTEPRLHPATQAPSLASSRPYILGFDHHIYCVSRAESLHEQAHSHSLMGSSAGSRPSTNDDDSYLSASPRAFDGGVWLEDGPVIVPSQVAFYRASSSHAHLSRSHLSAHQFHPTSKMGTTANSEAAQTRHT
ncbi:hypothetical protein FIBSPDRAFT_848938 [Athelia psychrophila]|uniref:Uncharacterized protein n=1 Tax=Athelia psychrophila TaxID=1759441 RepID=A0A166URR6_9AGAM|nr:hypothetical protein FIBSPDRAFT_848938 [Fibularhizoctonia sp. CBS 109695]